MDNITRKQTLLKAKGRTASRHELWCATFPNTLSFSRRARQRTKQLIFWLKHQISPCQTVKD